MERAFNFIIFSIASTAIVVMFRYMLNKDNVKFLYIENRSATSELESGQYTRVPADAASGI